MIIEENIPNEFRVLNILNVKTLLVRRLLKNGFQILKHGSRLGWPMLVIQFWNTKIL